MLNEPTVAVLIQNPDTDRAAKGAIIKAMVLRAYKICKARARANAQRAPIKTTGVFTKRKEGRCVR